MSRSRSEVGEAGSTRPGRPAESRPGGDDGATDPLRPSDHVDGTAAQNPALGPVGWLRWAWRQLTSMRTALVLLLLLAIAAVPGSIVPQRSADPNGVAQYFRDNPGLAPVLDRLQLFDVYSSAWFSGIYLLLFISLIGCVIPRTRHHLTALRARPPRTPARLARLDDHRDALVELAPGTDAAAAAEASVALAAQQLKRGGYRVQRYDEGAARSVSAERGYLRETGNLVFHVALIGVLVAVALGGGYTYTGQRVLVEGQGFVNDLIDYSSFNPGRFVDTDALPPFALTLDRFDVTYGTPGTAGGGQAGDFAAQVTTRLPGADTEQQTIRVNHPLSIQGDRVYLLGNGYAPTITVRNAAGTVVFSDSVPFLPQSPTLTSLGVVKVPDQLTRDGSPVQMGLVGFFYPTEVKLDSGASTSAFGDLVYPVLSLDVWVGDLGIDGGAARNVYALDTTDMTALTGRSSSTGAASLRMMPGDTVDLPDGMGSVTFENVAPAGSADFEKSVHRFVSLSIHHDAAGPWVLVFAVIALAGLLAALFVPRRRMWVKAVPEGSALRLEYAGLARGEDPTLGRAVEEVERRHLAALDEAVGAASARPAADRPPVD